MIPEGFLGPEEVALLGLVVSMREDAFMFTFEEKGYFIREYYPDYEIPVIRHTPWQHPPICVPRAIEELVRSEICKQTKAGRFRPTTSSYRSSLYCIGKKDPTQVRMVLDLRDLNSVNIRDSALPPNVEDFAKGFVGRAIYGSIDLFSGFDARILQ